MTDSIFDTPEHHESMRPGAYRQLRELILTMPERGTPKESIRLAISDILRDIDTKSADFWRRDSKSGFWD